MSADTVLSIDMTITSLPWEYTAYGQVH